MAKKDHPGVKKAGGPKAHEAPEAPEPEPTPEEPTAGDAPVEPETQPEPTPPEAPEPEPAPSPAAPAPAGRSGGALRRYQVWTLGSLKLSGKLHDPGSTVCLTESDAAALGSVVTPID